ncbi:HET domain-containing protein [Colletotrichum simmondsii]|uniref:HET domain-containing protein n=1 Tax=Colletotrichum simmondsii TaxID=703756 RepID=A0A135S2K5_9PEZI|nr:HET domain-containing protein [Colletotrichum simmondsii]
MAHPDLETQFLDSKWFTRGWTLQELIAPRDVNFYDHDWRLLGTKQSLLDIIYRATGIDKQCLLGAASLSGFSIAKIMSWAAGRVTTRLQDQAYCLLGLFDVNMPLLYGEGEKAFVRLQQEIIRISDDQSVFVCDLPRLWASTTAATPLATSPSLFANSTHVSRWSRLATSMATIPPFYTVTNAGLSISLPLIQTLSPRFVLGILNCKTVGKYGSGSVCLPLSSHLSDYQHQYNRVSLPAPWMSLSSASIKPLLPWHEVNAAQPNNLSSNFIPEVSTNIMITMPWHADYDYLSRQIFEPWWCGPSWHPRTKAAKIFCFVTFPRGLSCYRLYAADPPKALHKQTSMMAMLDQEVTDGKGRGLLVRDRLNVATQLNENFPPSPASWVGDVLVTIRTVIPARPSDSVVTKVSLVVEIVFDMTRLRDSRGPKGSPSDSDDSYESITTMRFSSESD